MPVTKLASKKFGRERDQRRALLSGLASALFEHESIETTEQKAKALRPYAEKLITKAKKNTLHARRQLISVLNPPDVAHKLMDEIAPKLDKRDSGYLRIERTELRRGDSAQMAKISFVDSLEDKPVATKPAKSKAKKTESKAPKKTKESK